MMAVVMIVTAAAFVVVMMLFMMIVAAAAFVVVMMLFMMIVAAFVIVMVLLMMIVFSVMIMTFLMVMVMMMSVFMDMAALRAHFFLHHLLFQRYGVFHYLQKLLSVQILDGSCDNGGSTVDPPEKLHGGRGFVFVHNIRPAHDDRSGVLYLIIEELAEVSHIHFAFLGVYHRCVAVQHQSCILLNALYCFDHIGELAYAGRLNQNPVRMIGGDNFLQGSAEISHQRAADTAGIHLSDLDPRFLQETAVDADLSEFVFNKDHLFILEGFFQKFFDQSCLAGSKKSGHNINFCHYLFPLFFIIFLRTPGRPSLAGNPDFFFKRSMTRKREHPLVDFLPRIPDRRGHNCLTAMPLPEYR